MVVLRPRPALQWTYVVCPCIAFPREKENEHQGTFQQGKIKYKSTEKHLNYVLSFVRKRSLADKFDQNNQTPQRTLTMNEINSLAY